MSIVEDTGPPKRATPPRFLVGISFLLLLAAQIAVLLVYQKQDQAAVDGAASLGGGALAWQSTDSAPMGPVSACFLILIGWLLVNGVRGRKIAVLASRPWLILGIITALIAYVDVADRLQPKLGGFVKDDRAVFTADGRPTVSHAWSEASQLLVGCWIDRPRRGAARPEALYRVVFPDGRSAELSAGSDYDPEAADKVEHWLSGVAPVNAAVRAGPGVTVGATAMDPDCNKAYESILGEEGRQRFRALFEGVPTVKGVDGP